MVERSVKNHPSQMGGMLLPLSHQVVFEHPEIPLSSFPIGLSTTIHRMVEFHGLKKILELDSYFDNLLQKICNPVLSHPKPVILLSEIKK